eukprot:1141786-Pelagomonas_calceolata.AAC.1
MILKVVSKGSYGSILEHMDAGGTDCLPVAQPDLHITEPEKPSLHQLRKRGHVGHRPYDHPTAKFKLREARQAEKEDRSSNEKESRMKPERSLLDVPLRTKTLIEIVVPWGHVLQKPTRPKLAFPLPSEALVRESYGSFEPMSLLFLNIASGWLGVNLDL